MVHVAHFDAVVLQIVGEILRHLLGEGGDQHSLFPGGAGVDLADEVVDLPLHRPHLDLGVQQTGGTNDLLHDLARPGTLVLTGGGGDVDHLVEPLFKLLEFQRPVVVGAGQTEAVVHQGVFPRPVAVVHGPHLGQGDVALVDKQHEILGEVVQQGVGRGTYRTPLDDPGVVLNAGAVAQFLHHLHVVHGTLLDALGLDELALLLKVGHPLLQLLVDLLDSGVHLLLGGNVVGGGPDGDMAELADGGAGDHVNFRDTVNFIPKKLHPDGGILPVGGPHLHRVPPHPKHVALKGDVVALIADGD